MAINKDAYLNIIRELGDKSAILVAVSKTQSVDDIRELYDLGQRDFGENYVQELLGKQSQLPQDIRWHFIGHLQSNKVKAIAPFVHLIQSVDSEKLLEEINRQAANKGRVIDCLLQVHISNEETKFGFGADELNQFFESNESSKDSHRLQNVNIRGLMGMASFTSDLSKVADEFRTLKSIYSSHRDFTVLSMGMSQDYPTALKEGSNMARIGSLIFGARSILH